MGLWILVGGGLIAAVIWFVRARVKRQAAFAHAVTVFKCESPNEREPALERLLAACEIKGPAWYLLGCIRLRAGRIREAARAFGMAYHNDDRLESAALLTFACLKSREGTESLVEQMVATWNEMNRPELLMTNEDQQLVACIGEGHRPAEQPSPLIRLAGTLLGPEAAAEASALLGTTTLDRAFDE